MISKFNPLCYRKNPFGIDIRICCASCAFKDYATRFPRFCSHHHKEVKALWVCDEWQMNDGLKNAGINMGGVVRLRGTKEVIIG